MICAAAPLGNPVASGGAASPFEGQLVGTSRDYLFTLTNTGQLGLDLQTITLGGADAAPFSLAHPDLSANPDLAKNKALTITITFQPAGGSRTRSATLAITSDDSVTPVHTVNLSGQGLSDSADGDSDGMNDWAEYDLRGFGFDGLKTQNNLVADYCENAPSAGLLTLDQVAGMKANTSLLDVNLTPHRAKFTNALRQSDDLAPPFVPIVADRANAAAAK